MNCQPSSLRFIQQWQKGTSQTRKCTNFPQQFSSTGNFFQNNFILLIIRLQHF